MIESVDGVQLHKVPVEQVACIPVDSVLKQGQFIGRDLWFLPLEGERCGLNLREDIVCREGNLVWQSRSKEDRDRRVERLFEVLVDDTNSEAVLR